MSNRKDKKLVNFEVPADLLNRFDVMVEFICGSRTQVLLHLMKTFVEIFEAKSGIKIKQA